MERCDPGFKLKVQKFIDALKAARSYKRKFFSTLIAYPNLSDLAASLWPIDPQTPFGRTP